MKRYRITTWEAIAFGILATTLAGLGFWQMAHQIRGTLLIVCPGFALTVLLWLGSDGTIEGLAEWVHARPARIAVAPAGLWLLYMAVPFLAMSFTARAEPLVILWLWLPLELGVIRSVLIMSTTGLDLHYVLAQLLALDAGVIAFAVWNRTPAIGYRFETDQKILSNALIHFVLFAAIAIPLGLTIGFIQYSFATSKLYAAPLLFIGIFLFTALPEEFLFRGLIQNWIERTTRRQVFSLASASLIFGASHLNNGPPVPNYKYFFMASIAGLFYGRAWRNTGSLMASSLTHALVDTFWSMIFR